MPLSYSTKYLVRISSQIDINDCGVPPAIKLCDNEFEFGISDAFDEVYILSIEDAEKWI